MEKILFQGDSITDCDRVRTSKSNVGDGYVCLVKSQLSFDFPEKYTFFNRGVAGDRIVDVYARIKKDILNLEPDYISFLVGVNDVSHEIYNQNGVSADKFEKIYGMMIEEIREILPNVKMMILEPFCLRGKTTDNDERVPNMWQIMDREVREVAKRARKVAEKYDIPFIPLQDKFDELAAQTGNDYWLKDGVHPTAAGHELIKREWIKAFEILQMSK